MTQSIRLAEMPVFGVFRPPSSSSCFTRQLTRAYTAMTRAYTPMTSEQARGINRAGTMPGAAAAAAAAGAAAAAASPSNQQLPPDLAKVVELMRIAPGELPLRKGPRPVFPESEMDELDEKAGRLIDKLEMAVRSGDLLRMKHAATEAAKTLGLLPQWEEAWSDPYVVFSYVPKFWSPLNVASRYGNELLVRWLLLPAADGGGGVDAIESKEGPGPGLDALRSACTGGHLTCVQLLVGAGVSVFPVDNPVAQSWPPLVEAAGYKRTELVRWLLDFYLTHAQSEVELAAALEFPNYNYGETPLHCAARAGGVAEARMLLAAGADPMKADRAERTPRALAERERHDKIARMLKGAEMEPERCPLLAKARLISDTRDALSALLTDPKAPPAPDAAAAHAAVLRIVPPCLQDRVAAALHSSYGDDIDPSDTDTGETALARHVLAALQSLPRVDVDLHVQDEVPPAFFYSVHYSPAGPTPLRLQRLEGAFRSVVSGSVLNEELYRELEGFMYPRGARERPWYLGGHASAGRLLI